MMSILNGILLYFITLVDDHGVEKIETVGDEYMAASSIPRARANYIVIGKGEMETWFLQSEKT